MGSYSYRTATTADLCYVPVLEDYAGAGRMRLPDAKIQITFGFGYIKKKIFYF